MGYDLRPAIMSLQGKSSIWLPGPLDTLRICGCLSGYLGQESTKYSYIMTASWEGVSRPSLLLFLRFGFRCPSPKVGSEPESATQITKLTHALLRLLGRYLNI